MTKLASSATRWTEMGLIPDAAVRAGIRRLLAKRLIDIQANDIERAARSLNLFVDQMCDSDIAPLPELANEQHYELPAEFFTNALGKHRKYSCCYWQTDTHDLDQAETESLAITCERAGLQNGMDILELGCGWGSLSLWMAEHYPDSTITSVSNSSGQRRYIENQIQQRGLSNLQVITCDMNDFMAARTYDRVVSVEMFEHMRNYQKLFGRVDSWLKPGGRFFMHIFCHRHCAYAFEDNGPDDWMSRYFFSGGIMPSVDLPLRFQRDLKICDRWIWDGCHYEKTANAWLNYMDDRKDQIMPILEQTYGVADASKWFMRWRMFFMACAELFGYNDGKEWFVGHYLFEKGDPVVSHA